MTRGTAFPPAGNAVSHEGNGLPSRSACPAIDLKVEAQNLDAGQFAVPVYRGPRAQPDFSGPSRHFAMFRTAIRNGFAGNPIVAGHYTLITVGCGTSCRFSWLGDLQTGKIIAFPIGGEDYPMLDIRTAPKSRLLAAQWGSYAGNVCNARLYAVDKGTVVQIGPDRRKDADC